MKEKKRASKDLSEEEIQLIQRLRRHPRILERVQSILGIADNVEGPLKTADQIEELLIEETRRLGSATMHEWAAQAEERVGRELQDKHPAVLKRKKKH